MPATPRTIITLHEADEGDKRIWVTERPEAVRALINLAGGDRLVKFARVRAGHIVSFATRPNNVVNVEQAEAE